MDKIPSVDDRNADMLNITLTNHVHTIQGQGKATAGEMFGEIGVLCHRPQPFTVRTRELCQILRLNRTPLMNIIQANTEDGSIIISNFLQVIIILCSYLCIMKHHLMVFPFLAEIEADASILNFTANEESHKY